MRNFTAAPVAAGAYPAGHNWDKKRALVHRVELDSNDTPISVSCGTVKVESILDDATQFNAKPLSCPRCIKIATRLNLSDG